MDFNERLQSGYQSLIEQYPQIKDAQKRFYTKINHLLSANAKILAPHALMAQEAITLSITNAHWRITVVEPHMPFLNQGVKRVEALDLDSRIAFENCFLAELPARDFEAAFLSFVLNAMEPIESSHLLEETASRIKVGGYLFLTLVNQSVEPLTPILAEDLGLEALGFKEITTVETEGPVQLISARKG